MISTTLYVSTLHHELDTGEMTQLLEAARKKNTQNEISGMLTVRGRDVMQVLEGDAAAVRDLYGKISADPRHSNVVTVWSSMHTDRRFPEWSMGFDDLDTEPLPGSESWRESNFAALPQPDQISQDTADYVGRRAAVLRRALYSGNRLMTTLAIILDGHRPETILTLDGNTRHCCAECRLFTGPGLERYPCSTARNAIWALESVLPPVRA